MREKKIGSLNIISCSHNLFFSHNLLFFSHHLLSCYLNILFFFPPPIILLPQYIMLFPPHIILLPQYIILFPSHIILLPQYIILSPPHIILLPQYIILLTQHIILFPQYIFCSHNILYLSLTPPPPPPPPTHTRMINTVFFLHSFSICICVLSVVWCLNRFRHDLSQNLFNPEEFKVFKKSKSLFTCIFCCSLFVRRFSNIQYFNLHVYIFSNICCYRFIPTC